MLCLQQAFDLRPFYSNALLVLFRVLHVDHVLSRGDSIPKEHSNLSSTHFPDVKRSGSHGKVDPDLVPRVRKEDLGWEFRKH